MFYWIIISMVFIFFLWGEIHFLKNLGEMYSKKYETLEDECLNLSKEESYFKKEVDVLENALTGRFLFHDIARKIAPIVEEEKLLEIFCEEINSLGHIEDIKFCDKAMNSDYLQYKAENKDNGFICVKTKSQEVIEYLPCFAKLLQLCRERSSLYNRLQELSVYDPLTKTYNRRNFMKRFLEEFERVKRFKLNLSYLMIDIDYFKKVNDTYGHLIGDAVLIKVSQLININLREIDFVARMGGEEFVVILPQTDKSEAAKIAERIRLKIFDEEIKVFDESFNISISIGISSFPADTENQEILMEFADKALYKAKDSGRNKVCLFSL